MWWTLRLSKFYQIFLSCIFFKGSLCWAFASIIVYSRSLNRHSPTIVVYKYSLGTLRKFWISTSSNNSKFQIVFSFLLCILRTIQSNSILIFLSALNTLDHFRSSLLDTTLLNFSDPITQIHCFLPCSFKCYFVNPVHKDQIAVSIFSCFLRFFFWIEPSGYLAVDCSPLSPNSRHVCRSKPPHSTLQFQNRSNPTSANHRTETPIFRIASFVCI